MSKTILTVDGDRLDKICWAHYGSTEGRIVERALEANPGLSSVIEFPAGTRVFLPNIELTEPERSLW